MELQVSPLLTSPDYHQSSIDPFNLQGLYPLLCRTSVYSPMIPLVRSHFMMVAWWLIKLSTEGMRCCDVSRARLRSYSHVWGLGQQPQDLRRGRNNGQECQAVRQPRSNCRCLHPPEARQAALGEAILAPWAVVAGAGEGLEELFHICWGAWWVDIPPPCKKQQLHFAKSSLVAYPTSKLLRKPK